MIFSKTISLSVLAIAMFTSCVGPVESAPGDLLARTQIQDIRTIKTDDGLSLCYMAIQSRPRNETYSYEIRCVTHIEYKDMFGLAYKKQPESLIDVFKRLPVRLLNPSEKKAKQELLKAFAPRWRIQPYRNYPDRPVHDIATGKTVKGVRVKVGTVCGEKSGHTSYKWHRKVIVNGKTYCAVCGFK